MSAATGETFGGYTLDGLLGDACGVSGSLNTSENVATLYRLTAGNGHYAHRASLTPAQALVARRNRQRDNAS